MSRKRKCKSLLMHLICGSRKFIKGSISLFLAIIVTPLLGMTLLLVESIRYQDVIETMIEIEDLSSFATLGNYDQFMKDRFGLLSVDQKNDITTVYNKYFNENSAMYQGDLTINSVTVNGDYALCDKDIFERQILAYGEMSCILQVLCEGLDIEEVLKMFNDKLKKDTLNDALDAASHTSSALRHLGAIKDAIVEAVKYQKTYDDAYKAYQNAYTDFEKSALNYVDKLKASSASTEAPDYSAEAVVAAWKELTEDEKDPNYGYIIKKSPRTKYLEAVNSLNNAILTYSNKISDVYQRLNDLKKDLKDLKKDGEIKNAQLQNLIELLEKTKPLDEYMGWLGVDDKGVVEAQSLSPLQTKLNPMYSTNFNKSTTQSNIKSTYYISINSKWSGVGEALSLRKSQLEGGYEGKDEATNLVDMLYSMLNLTGLWDPALDSVVSEADFYNKVDPQYSAVGICLIIQGLLDGIDSVTNPSDFWDFIGGVVELIASVIAFIGALVAWVLEFTANMLYNLFKNGLGLNFPELSKDIIVAGYAAYNFSNRRTYEDVLMPISGYKYYDNIYRGTCETTATTVGLTGTMNSIDSVMKGDNKVNATLFKGAETEYLLCGLNSELKNQIGAFFNVFMFRVVLDFAASWANDEVKTAAGVFYICPVALQLLICMGEAIFDTFILVNGGDEFLLKKDFYLTASGAMFLVGDLINCGNAKQFKEAYQAANPSFVLNEPPKGMEKRGLFYCKANYTEHLFWLLLLGSNRDTTLLRMQNVVKLEAYSYHAKVDNYDTYDFTKTYTYVHTNVDFTVKPMFNFDSMTEPDSSFTGMSIKHERYCGY